MIDRNTKVVGVTADLNLTQFMAILDSNKSPVMIYGPAIYNLIIQAKISPAFALAQFREEDSMGTTGLSVKSFNPGNVRTSLTGLGTALPTAKGQFIYFRNWLDGWKEYVTHLTASNSVYAQEGRTTIEEIITRWAPPSENNTEQYISNVISFMSEWLSSSKEVTSMQDPTSKIDIVHPNKGREGANPEVIVLHVQEGTNYLPGFFKSSGDDSTMWCMQDGTLIRMEQDSDSAWTNGFMSEPLDHSNPHIQSLVNRGVTNSNNYSLTIEHQGFASGQFTSAAIEATAKMCAYWMSKYGWTDVDTRIVGHAAIGQHKGCPGPNFPWSKLRARVKELLAGGSTILTTDNHTPLPAPVPAVAQFPTGKGMANGFLGFYNHLKDLGLELLTFGYPVTEEFICPVDGKQRTVQLGQRACLIWESENAAPWDVHFTTVDQSIQIKAYAAANKLL
jgi:hypothetical protein